MELGVAIAIFIISSIALMALFCLVTKYFSIKMRKALAEQTEIYSLVEGIEGEREDINEGEYEDFVQKRIDDREKKAMEKDENFLAMREMSTAEPLKNAGERIYEMSKLKQRLGIDEVDLALASAARTLFTSKTFKDSGRYLSNFKLNTGKSNLPTYKMNTHDENGYTETGKYHNKITEHKFVNKIVGYQNEGVSIFSCKVQQLKKDSEESQIQEINKKITSTEFTNEELGAEEALEMYGFEIGTYGAYKFTVNVEIPNMKFGEAYKISSLKKSEQKEDITLEEFEAIKTKFIEEQKQNINIK